MTDISGNPTPDTIDEQAPPAIVLDDVWVQYRLRHAHHYNLKRTFSNLVTRRHDQTDVITALAGVTISIPQKARIGLSGANGAGKSTLLSVLAGALTPTRGSVLSVGRVLALLGGPNEGLDPEQTGRENALSLGIRLGESLETMQGRIDEIWDFSGLGSRFDHPVYSYSTGMQVRLRFSTLTSIQADILIVDESIGAADAEFNARAATRLQKFFDSTPTLVLASHSERHLAEYCTEIIHLSAGRLAARSPQ